VVGPFHFGQLNGSSRSRRRSAIVQNDLCSTEPKQLVDQHQVISIIANAICECFKEPPEQDIDPEEAKQVAKCIIEALTEVGLEIGVHNGS
jgi:hypothetical protein